MAARHLTGLAAERQSQQLMAEANAEDGLTPVQQPAQNRHRVSAGRGWVTRTVRQENTVGPVANYILCRGSGGDYSDMAAERREHPQDVAFGAVIDCYDVVTGTLLEAITSLSVPHGFGPLVGLAAGYFLGQVHSFETRPDASPITKQTHVEASFGIMCDDGFGGAEIANMRCQPPGIDP